jgi:L-ascorbate 6-phosphate lactonase
MHPFADFSVPDGKAGVHWFGQNSWAFKSPGGKTVLVDPYFPHQRPADTFIHREPPLTESELPVDAVIVTHDHLDHTHPETMKRIHAAWPKAVFLGPKESAKRAQEAGIPAESFVTVEAGGTCQAGDFEAHFTYSKPPAGDPRAKIKPPDVTHLGVVLALRPAVRLYVSGDCINTFAELDELVAPVRKLAPQIGFLTCHPTEGEFPFFDGCAKMAQRIGVKTAFPSHYQCFVKRNYDPVEWAKAFEGSGVEPRTVGYDASALAP